MTPLEKHEEDVALVKHERDLLAKRSPAQKAWDGYQDFLEAHPYATPMIRFAVLALALIYFLFKVVLAR